MTAKRIAAVLALALVATACARRLPVPVAQDVGLPIPEPAIPRLADATEALGLAEQAATYVNWLDANNNGLPDLLVNGDRLFLNQGPPFYKFAPAPPDFWTGARQGPVLCVDVDNDGWTDIVSTRGQLWLNQQGNGFVDVAGAWGFAPHPKGNVLAAGDFNGDGWTDLFLGMKEDWNDGKPVYHEHELWLNREGKGFREAGREAGIRRKTYARSALVFDVNGDGHPDIFVGNYRLQPNFLWLNDGKGGFRDAARDWGVAGRNDPGLHLDPVTKQRHGPSYGHTIGACLLDFDNDGQLDLFAANLVHKYAGPSRGGGYDIRGYVCDDSAIWRRQGDQFVDWRAQLGLPPMPIGPKGVYQGDELWAGCVAGDVNNDGWEDVFVPQIYNLDYARCRLFLNAGGRRFLDRAEAAGLSYIDSYAGAWADLNGNGRLDLATAGRAGVDQPPRLRLHRNDGGEGMMNHLWLRVSLAPGPERRTPLGSIVTVTQGEKTRVRQHTCGTSTYGQQNDPVLHFGLGPDDSPVTVTVRWPNGITTTRTSPPATTLSLVMPATQPVEENP